MKYLATAALALVFGANAHAQPLRDPFARPAPPPPPVVAESAAPEVQPAPPRLRAIMYAPNRSLANINGQILAVGEWFGEFQLTEIQQRSVTLSRRNAKSVLSLDEAGGK